MTWLMILDVIATIFLALAIYTVIKYGKDIQLNKSLIASLEYSIKRLDKGVANWVDEFNQIISSNAESRGTLWRMHTELAEALGYEYKDDKVTITAKRYVKKAKEKKPRGKK